MSLISFNLFKEVVESGISLQVPVFPYYKQNDVLLKSYFVKTVERIHSKLHNVSRIHEVFKATDRTYVVGLLLQTETMDKEFI